MATTEELLKEAQALNEAKEYGKVIELLSDEVLEKHKSADLYAEAAQAYYRTSQYDLSIKAADNALSIEGMHAKANHYKGNWYADIKDYDNAIDAYKRAISKKPNFAFPHQGIGLVYHKLQKYDDAIRSFNDAIRFDPQFSFPYSNLGSVYLDLKDYDKAIKFYNKAIEIDNVDASFYIGLGDVYLQQKNYSNAIKAYEKAIEIDSNNARAYYNLGTVYRELKQYDTAINTYNKAIEIDAKLNYIYNSLGNIYADLKQYDRAIREYSKAIEIDSKNYIPYYNRAITFYELEQYAEALRDYEKQIELTGNSPDIYTSNAKERIKELKRLLEETDFTKIRDLIEQIKDSLLHNDGCITHYTSLTTARKLILENSPLRLSEGAFLNDSSEGRELFKFLPSFNTSSLPLNDTTVEPFAKKPFIGSFVPQNRHDDLTLWRMYGKENKEDAKGCAITIDSNELVESIKTILTKDSSINDDEDLKFYRVAYRRQNPPNPFFIPGTDDNQQANLNKYLDQLKEKIEIFLASKARKDSDTKHVLEQLNSIAYLFKSAAYEHEHELRLIIKGIRFTKDIDTDLNPPWVHIKLVDIVPLIRKITLGPKMDKKDEWASVFYYSIAQQLKPENLPPDIYISHLPFK